MSQRALICGISGQDGTYLAKLLLERGFEVWGSSRDAEQTSFRNARQLGIYDSLRLVSLHLRDVGSTIGLLQRIRPHYVYNLTGQSSVGLSFEQPVETVESIALGTLNLLEAVRLTDRDIRLYNAGSTECFGDTGDGVANETTQLQSAQSVCGGQGIRILGGGQLPGCLRPVRLHRNAVEPRFAAAPAALCDAQDCSCRGFDCGWARSELDAWVIWISSATGDGRRNMWKPSPHARAACAR